MPLPVRRKRGGPLDQRLRGRAPPPEDGGEATLQLAIGKEGVGLELSKAIELGPVTLLRARSRLLGLGFPLDVSGGVDRFRHRRTTLEEVGLTVDHGRTERWLSSITEGLIAGGPAEARIGWSAPPDVGVGESPWEREEHVVWSSGNVRIELATDRSVCAFDMAIAPQGGGLCAIAHRVRALGTPRSPTAIVGALLARIARALDGECNGLRLLLPDPVKAAVLAAFVSRGARVPTREELVISQLRPEVELFRIEMRRAQVPAAPSSLFVALHELDRLLEGADAALVANDLEKARELYVRALDRAPRQRAILTRLAELDAFTGERTEAAVSWLREAQRGRGRRGLDGNDLGRTLLAGLLAERTGALGRARAAWERGGNWAFDRGESRLASRAWARAAAVASDDDPQLPSLLDRALSADPAETESRWRRVHLALSFGDDARAMEDVQHLEAQAKGRARRLETLMRAGAVFREMGRLDRAVPAWERALRHAPDDARVLSGLGSALLSAGETARAISLLSRAIALPSDERSTIILELARALADGIGDIPAAISRLREIAGDDPHAAHARALEGAYRLRVGDQVGAEHAYAAAAADVERRGVHGEDVRTVAELLVGGAKVVQLDYATELAMRLAMAALSIAPSDPQIQGLVRDLGRIVGARLRVEAPEPTTDPGLVDEPVQTSLGISLDDDEPISPPDQEARAEALLARVKANPDDEEAIDALVELLGALGRDFELFALLQARWEDATTEERSAMIPRQRTVLHRMADKADARGATMEAQLYLDAAAALGD